MKLVFFGTGRFGIPSLEALRASSHELLAVVTLPDKPRGRHLRAQPSPVKDWALEHSVAVFEETSSLRALGADLFVVISFGVILPEAVLGIPRLGCFNVHPSLLPRWRGAAPIQWAILSGDAQTGVTLMRMTSKLDAGDIVLQKKTTILPGESFTALEKRLGQLGAEALVEGLGLLESGRAVFTPQEDRRATTARKIRKEDGHVDWRRSAACVVNHVRAMSGWPVAFSFHKGRRLLLLDAVETSERVPGAGRPGSVLAAAKSGLRVAAADKAVEIRSLQGEGRKALPAAEFLKGYPLRPGDVLE